MMRRLLIFLLVGLFCAACAAPGPRAVYRVDILGQHASLRNWADRLPSLGWRFVADPDQYSGFEVAAERSPQGGRPRFERYRFLFEGRFVANDGQDSIRFAIGQSIDAPSRFIFSFGQSNIFAYPTNIVGMSPFAQRKIDQTMTDLRIYFDGANIVLLN